MSPSLFTYIRLGGRSRINIVFLFAVLLRCLALFQLNERYRMLAR